MNNSLQILRRVLTLRNYNRVITQRYSAGNESRSDDQSTKVSKEPEERVTVKTEEEHKPEKETNTSDVKFSEVQVSGSGSDQTYDSSLKPLLHTPRRKPKNIKTESQTDTSAELESEQPQEKSSLESEENVGFLAAYKKQEKFRKTLSEPKKKDDHETFASMFRNSAFVDIGNPAGKVVLGKIFNITNNDLYIDFGWKFHTVCSVPERSIGNYKIGSKVLLKIVDLELTAKFLGDVKYTSLLEADCKLLSVVESKTTY
ncbi:UNVERIFIED_CONTAM: hypothetical protein PYX00_002091 [Menopon gallinae]|uniref:28S ribosomal protein S28, mitochondrial n=1 Tax=Menopon gallinae TaxID=328185 RepID=A0AAW2IGR2_9NEOP